MALDWQGRIAGLRFTGVVPTGATIDSVVGTIRSLPGQVSLLVLRDGKERASLQPDAPLAVGSAFKLIVLRGLADAIGAHRLAWDQVVRLDSAWRSLPSGFLQTWPAGTPLTIETLADAMISVSDNTAADALIHLVGREPLQALSPRNTPFLTTRELFTLKSPGLADRSNAWQSLTPAARQGLLDEASRAALPDPFALALHPGGGPEWFVTAREICTLLGGLKDIPAFRINDGGFAGADWKSIAFKGGSEPGVLNLSVYAVGHDGRGVCVSATWNDTRDVEAGKLFAPVSRLLHLMGRGEK
jgi:beta-lactamase class A